MRRIVVPDCAGAGVGVGDILTEFCFVALGRLVAVRVTVDICVGPGVAVSSLVAVSTGVVVAEGWAVLVGGLEVTVS